MEKERNNEENKAFVKFLVKKSDALKTSIIPVVHSGMARKLSVKSCRVSIGRWRAVTR